MAKDRDKLTANFESENTGGLLSGFLAEEDVFDRRALWRLGSWGAASVGAVVLAVYANQSSIAVHREQAAVAVDLLRQAQQIELVARESRNEARQLASAIETLNNDRDRLFSRVTGLEQGLESVTGAIAKQQAASATSPPAAPASAQASTTTEPLPPAQNPPSAPAPVPSPVATTAPKGTEKTPAAASPVAAVAPKVADKPSSAAAVPDGPPTTVASLAQKPSNPPAATATPAITPAAPLVAEKSMMAPPDASASKLIEPDKPETSEKSGKADRPEKPAKIFTAAPMPEVVAAATPADDAEPEASAATLPKLAVQRTEFGVDVGGANSVGGLRALWRGLLKSRSNAALTTLRPIIVIKEGSNGLGMQLRLVAGPLGDAAAAAKICAGLMENDRSCETAVFDGQRLAMTADEPAATDKPVGAKPAVPKPSLHRRGSSRRVAVEEPAKKPDPPPPSTLSSFFRRSN
ncbi:hypothetical protein [Bradyrhizobium erythrophlei]|jgi:hypothetical protein|uniref:Sporulation related domain-containing protein n=1 Tax=Bradyrhizobium erythrophlei TaxID=1437360 RepID=A0A1M5RLM3_9BRAD|nr:hypothetical protein [Bradyrhizobium erythrophlei]SHH26958.1 hypothetical protein SAMN05444169_6630 [Bradyrhizobium erythrophlei]